MFFNELKEIVSSQNIVSSVFRVILLCVFQWAKRDSLFTKNCELWIQGEPALCFSMSLKGQSLHKKLWALNSRQTCFVFFNELKGTVSSQKLWALYLGRYCFVFELQGAVSNQEFWSLYAGKSCLLFYELKATVPQDFLQFFYIKNSTWALIWTGKNDFVCAKISVKIVFPRL